MGACMRWYRYVKKDTSADDVYRRLLNEKTKGQRKKLTLILEHYGITYQNVWIWLRGRKDDDSKPYLPPPQL